MYPYLQSSNRQFGFKKGVGCRDAIFSLNSIIDHYNDNNSTINLCSLDLSKAFDRVYHSMFLKKMKDRNIPQAYIISTSENWFYKVFISVKWGDAFSPWVRLTSGVRQEGILSPFLFSILVDLVLKSWVLIVDLDI